MHTRMFYAHYRKLLCEDRIRVFDKHQELDMEIPKLNILNAINWTAQAWDSVTDDTIHRCWQRTGILPDNEMCEGESELENELEAEENEIQSLIHQMNVDDIVASNYINIDTRIEVTDMIDERDIIAAVQEAPEEEDGEEEREEESIKISNTAALDSIQLFTTKF